MLLALGDQLFYNIAAVEMHIKPTPNTHPRKKYAKRIARATRHCMTKHANASTEFYYATLLAIFLINSFNGNKFYLPSSLYTCVGSSFILFLKIKGPARTRCTPDSSTLSIRECLLRLARSHSSAVGHSHAEFGPSAGQTLRMQWI